MIALFLLAIIIAYVAGVVYESGKWVEKKELLGLKLGMTQQEVLSALESVGVQDVIPEPNVRLIINKKNIAQIDRLKSAPGICVTSNRDGINLVVSLNETGDVTKFFYGSVKKFSEFPVSSSINEFMPRLRAMILNNDGLVAFSCIPDNRWIHIKKAAPEDIDYLGRYDTWTFDEPSAYSGVRLKFLSGKVSKIEYRNQPSELP